METQKQMSPIAESLARSAAKLNNRKRLLAKQATLK
jgi:hypothetical protein